MYVHASVRFITFTYYCAYGQTCAYCRLGTTRGICTCHLLPVRCTLYLVWVYCTYDDDDDDDDDMTRCRIHRDAALREARERERVRGGVGKGGKLAWRGRGW